MPDKKPKPKPKGDVSYVVEFDFENLELLDFIWTEDHDPPPLVKPKKMRQDGEGEEKGKNKK